MTWADWTIVGVLVLSALISIKRGFVKEALSLATWVAAVIIAIIFADRLAVLLEDHIATPSVREMAAFALLFVATLLVGAHWCLGAGDGPYRYGSAIGDVFWLGAWVCYCHGTTHFSSGNYPC
jgi:hypothetical protein